ncbi:uncharacterized protein [Heptranchias perlo]|uniref:uncharacterized protein n=1 Tax=Heptranchias perlo TaxID=212740 RepID=UPI003559BA41
MAIPGPTIYYPEAASRDQPGPGPGPGPEADPVPIRSRSWKRVSFDEDSIRIGSWKRRRLPEVIEEPDKIFSRPGLGTPTAHDCRGRKDSVESDGTGVSEEDDEAERAPSGEGGSPVDQPPVPYDPRSWSRDDVRRWLGWAVAAYSLSDVQADRFPLNGKALCLFTPHMFRSRAEDSASVLHADFRARLARALLAEQPQGRAPLPSV